MDRKKQIAALTDDEGERLLLAQACERLTRAEQRGIPAATVFLTPREQALLRQLLPQCRFWGRARRTRSEPWPIGCLNMRTRTTTGKTARSPACAPHFLRKMPSDTATCSARSWLRHPPRGRRRPVPAAASMRPVRHGGACTVSPRQPDLRRRAHLTLTRIAPSQADRPPQALQELRVTVSSPRLDSVISAAFHLSRGSAADAVAAGRVNLNDLTCLKPTAPCRRTIQSPCAGSASCACSPSAG